MNAIHVHLDMFSPRFLNLGVLCITLTNRDFDALITKDFSENYRSNTASSNPGTLLVNRFEKMFNVRIDRTRSAIKRPSAQILLRQNRRASGPHQSRKPGLDQEQSPDHGQYGLILP